MNLMIMTPQGRAWIDDDGVWHADEPDLVPALELFAPMNDPLKEPGTYDPDPVGTALRGVYDLYSQSEVTVLLRQEPTYVDGRVY